MATLELRPPQFSEDLAWLPCWLQHNQTTPSSEQEIESHYESAIKEFINKLEDTSLSPKDGGCNNCHLFLSGQDSLLESIDPSSYNAPHFHLHLSSYGGSECTPTQHLDESSHLLEYNKAQSISLVEASLDPRENISSREGINAVDVDLLPQSRSKDIVDNVVCQSPTNTEDQGNQWGEKSNVSYLKSAEVNNAIELSVAASEALVIHDMLKTELDSEALSVEAVLEVSIQVKRARIELLESAYESLNEEMDWNDSLSDLDDLIMRDAFDDVGLPCGILSSEQCKTIGFDVQDTSVNENQSTHGSQCNSIDMISQQDAFGNGFSLKQLEESLVVTRSEGLPLEHVSCNIQNQLSDGVVLASTGPNHCKYDDPMLEHSAWNESDEFVVKQKTVSSTVNTSLCMFHAKENSNLHDCNTVSTNNEEQVAFFTPDRFQSRWLGGWTGKELDVSEQLRQNGDGKTIPSMFVNETSFLSESADIAPDENSCVQRCESKCQVASQSSVLFGHLDEKGDEGLPVTEDIVKCSLSLVDPLCSYVPCSILSDTDCAKQNLNEGKDFTKECLGTSVDIGGSRPLIRRQSTSLNTYSTILPTHVDLEGGNVENNYSHQQQQGNISLLSLDPRLDCTRLSCKKKIVETLPSWPPSKSRNMDIMEDYQTDADHNLIAEITELKSKSDEVAGDGTEFLDQSVKEKITPAILIQSLQVSKPIMKKPSIKKNHLQSSGTETAFNPQKVGNFMKMQYESKNSPEPSLLVQKRVRFFEANDQPQENQDLQKVQPSPKNYSALRTGKRRKFSSQCLVSCHRDVSRYCKSRKILIFQGIQFLVTGFSGRKVKDIEGLVWNNGGMVLPDIPCPSSRGKKMSKSNCKGPPIILSSKKLQTTKFLYGCAVNALIVNASWLTDSIAAGSMLPPWKYMIISNQPDCTQMGRSFRHSSRRYIFENVGVMLHGKQGFCTKLTKVLEHGGGQVFKTLQWLVKSINKEKLSVGVIVVEDEYKASRHLKQCALEQGIPIMSAKWVIKSLHLGELLPLTDYNRSASIQTAKMANVPAVRETSLEI